ncbi:MAG TPA: ATP-binding protein [Thermoanaerobaculia bacterium]|nr:ATP-binding protein [Thermoanaerobaculia bacterium]
MELERAATGESRATAERPVAPTSPLHGRSLPVFVALTLASFAGNYFATSLFFGLDFLFGSIFALLAVVLYGPVWGTASAAVAASYTYFLWGHPWAAVILAAEALTVGVLAPRLRHNLLLADGLYWLLLGMPLAALFYGGVMASGAEPTLLVMLKQSVNGIFNALVASLLLTHTRLRTLAGVDERRAVPLRQVIFELLVTAVLVPLLALVVVGTRQDLRKLEGDLLSQLDQTADSLSSRIGSWRERHVQAVVQLATVASEAGVAASPELQRDVELLHRAFPELAVVYVADAAGQLVAADPQVDEAGQPLLGQSIAGRPWLAPARRSGRPVLTDVFRSRLGRREPAIAIAVPVLRGSTFAGDAAGALDFRQLRGLLQLYSPSPGARITLTDGRGVVIASTVQSLPPLFNYRPEGELRPVGHGRYHRYPDTADQPAISRWRTSLYGRDVLIGTPPWHLWVELPVSPLQRFLQSRYLQAFGGMLGVCILALLLAATLASWLSRSLARLAEATTDLPERLTSGELPPWPHSRVAEVDSLARNFRRMAAALEERFQELTSTGSALRERSAQLAAANREMQSEVAERRRAEWALRLLAEAGSALAGSLEPQPTLERVVHGCVPALADWAVVVLDEGRPPGGRLAAAHRDAAAEPQLRALASSSLPLLTAPEAIDQPVLLGDPLDWTEMHGDGLAALLRGAGGSAALLLPLRARGKNLGTLVLVRAAMLVDGGDAFDRQTLGLAEELARRAALALDNAALYAELREADRRKDEFLAMLAHELRNPLSPVATSLQLLRSAGDDPAVAQRALAVMERQVGHIVRLVDDLLDVARITRGRIELQLDVLDLRAVVAQTVDNLRARFADREQELRLELATEAVPVRADPTRLDQVVANLLANANKYTRRGGHVLVRVERQDETAVIRVRDDGIGMPAELLSRVFELFMQSAQALDRSQGGLGIGLTLVRRLVELHGGVVVARSDGEDRGSEFEVRLPLHTGAVVAAASERSRFSPSSMPSRRVLVVDDNVEGAESLAELLRIWGHRVRVAHDGPSGLAAAAEQHPEVVLLDIGLPGLDGYEVGRRLRADAATCGAILVAVTGYGEQVHGGRLEEVGFDRLLVKPVDPPQLQQLLREPVRDPSQPRA